MADITKIYLDHGNIPDMLRHYADQIENNELEEINQCVVVFRSLSDDIFVSPLGDMTDDNVISLVTKTWHKLLHVETGELH